LDQLNAERQDEERRIMENIARRIEEEPALREAYCVVVDGDGWHRGVIGITATRVVERYGRPTLVVSREGEESYGSGRSVPAYHLLDALESCRELFSRFGGHAHAVGFAMPSVNVQKLREHLDTYARARLTLADFEPQLAYDRELPLDEVTPALHHALNLLEPFGMDNPEPVFAARGVRLITPPQAVKDKHVRLRIGPAAPESPAFRRQGAGGTPALREDFTPRCHPDSAAIPKRRSEDTAVVEGASVGTGLRPASTQSSWRSNITFKAMGWGLKESCDQLQLLAGDSLDIAYTIGMNDHPEFGGLELTLRDVVRRPNERG